MAGNQEREELHRAIWAIADELRGSVDGWDFKAYVLGIMFYRYISENLAACIDEGEQKAGNTGFSYAFISDDMAENAREDMINTKVFFLPSCSAISEKGLRMMRISMSPWRQYLNILKILQKEHRARRISPGFLQISM